MLFNEPKLLKYADLSRVGRNSNRFSALQRAEIAEMRRAVLSRAQYRRFSALQRAEIAEIARRNNARAA